MIIEGADLASVTISVDPIPIPETYWFYSYSSNTVGPSQVTEELALDGSKNVYTHAYLSGNLFGYNKVNSQGVSQGFDVYSNIGNSIAFQGINWSLSAAASGNVFRSQTITTANIAWSKFNTSGNIVFAKKVSRNNELVLYDSKVDISNGNLYEAGRSGHGTGPTITLATMMKVDQYTGNIIWAKYYPGATSNANYSGDIESIKVDTDGNIWAVGSAENPANQTDGIGVWKIDKSDGSIISQYIYRTTGFLDYGSTMGLDSQGNVIVAGTAEENGILMKIRSSNGQILWQKTTVGFEQFLGTIGIDTSDDIYIGGASSKKLSKLYGANGDVVWSRALSYGSGGAVYDVIVDGTSIYLGSTNGSNRALLGKLPIDGSGTGTYVGSGGSNIVYSNTTLTFGASTASLIVGNRITSNLACDLVDITSTRTNYSNVTITLNSVA